MPLAVLALLTVLATLLAVPSSAWAATFPMPDGEVQDATLEEFLESWKKAEREVRADNDFFYGYNAEDLAGMNGFMLQHYSVQSGDGYILDIWRLNDSVDPLFQDELAERVPVLIVHGLTCDGTIFMNNNRDNSLAYMMYDSGYDVWMVNFRGNTYSKKNVSMSPDSTEFWYFTMHEQGRYDLPAAVDLILENNRHKKVNMIGHSMGSAAIMVLLSMHEEFNFDASKVQSVVLTAPALISEHMTAAVFDEIHKMRDGEAEKLLFKIMGDGVLASHEDFGYILSSLAYHLPNLAIDVIDWACGPDETGAYEGDDVYYYLNYYPAGTSVYALAHYFQLIKRGGFQAYDYKYVDASLNQKKYGSSVPPTYDMDKVPADIPILLMPGENDTMACVEDVTTLFNQLNAKDRTYVELHVVNGYNHLSFMWGNNIDKYVYPKVMEFYTRFVTD